MSKRVSRPPKVRDDEVVLDSDSESEHEEFMDSSDDFVPRDLSENDSEVAEEEAFEFTNDRECSRME